MSFRLNTFYAILPIKADELLECIMDRKKHVETKNLGQSIMYLDMNRKKSFWYCTSNIYSKVSLFCHKSNSGSQQLTEMMQPGMSVFSMDKKKENEKFMFYTRMQTEGLRKFDLRGGQRAIQIFRCRYILWLRCHKLES